MPESFQGREFSSIPGRAKRNELKFDLPSTIGISSINTKNVNTFQEYTRIHSMDAHNKSKDRNSQQKNRNYKKETKIKKKN